MLRFLKVFFLSLILFIGLSACTDDDENTNADTGPDTSTALELLNVAYGTNSNQVYDAYLPANRTLNTKVIVLVAF